MEDRATILLTAAKELLSKQKEAGILIDHPITVHYDDADCDGYCLLDDITAFLEVGELDSCTDNDTQEIISAIQSGMPLYAPRCGGKRFTLSIVNQMAHLIKLEEEYNKLKGERADGLTEDNIDTE